MWIVWKFIFRVLRIWIAPCVLAVPATKPTRNSSVLRNGPLTQTHTNIVFPLGFPSPYNEYQQYLIWRERLSSFHALLDPFVILFSASGGFTNFQTLIKMETNQEICQETHKLCFILDQLSIVSLSDFTSFIGCTRQLSRQALVYHWTTTVTATGPHTSADVPVRTLTTGHKHLNSPNPPLPTAIAMFPYLASWFQI